MAFDRAAPGDRVELAAGSYGGQVVSGDKGSSVGVVIEPAPGASVRVVGELGVKADFVTVRGVAASEGYFVTNDQPANPIVGVRLERVLGPTAYFQNVRDLVVRGGDLGGRAGVKVVTIGAWPGSRGVTIDGVYLHDNPPTDPSQHLECVFAVHVQGLVVRNSRFHDCGYFGILTGTCCGGDQDWRDITLENNVFGPTRCVAGSFACPDGRAPYSLLLGGTTSSGGTNVIRNNLFLAPPSIESGALESGRFSNNVGAHGRCVAGLTYSHNLLARGRAARCGPTDLHADLRADYDERGRLLNPAGRAIGFADPTDVPPRDRFGDPRDQDPDAGPDEHTSGLREGHAAPTIKLLGKRFQRVCRTRRRGCRRTTARFRLLVSEPARLTVITRRVVRGRAKRRVRTRTLSVRRGVNPIRIRGRVFRKGLYRVTARAVDLAGNRSSAVRLRLRVVR